MKTIAKDDLFEHLNEFLKSRGIQLKQGRYAKGIRQGCHLLADVINATQRTVEKAKTEVDQKLQQLRESVHRATAPKPPVMTKAASAAKSKRPAAKTKAKPKATAKTKVPTPAKPKVTRVVKKQVKTATPKRPTVTAKKKAPRRPRAPR